MKKILIISAICLIAVGNVLSQTITQRQALDLIKKTFISLKKSDVDSFVDLWYLDNTGNPHDNTVFDRNQLVRNFEDLQLFLTVPIVKNLPFEKVEVSEMPGVFKAKYKIKAYFKIDNKLSLAYGFLADYINEKWVFRWHGETTISPKG